MKRKPDKYKMITRIIAIAMAAMMLLASLVAVIFQLFG